MTLPVGEFARLASVASRDRNGFEATQVVESGDLRVEAVVRRLGFRSIHVEYRTYQNPWTELEETLSGQVEFIGDELCGFGLHCDGQGTWIYDPSTNTAIRKIGYQMFEPIPGLATLGELAFLDTLTQDFLLRDLGEESIDEHVTRRITVKPKLSYRSQLLSTKTFPIRNATISFDTETYFPTGISFIPSSDSPASSIARVDGAIRITYNDVRIIDNNKALSPFAPPADARIFEESRVALSDLADVAPFPVQLAPLLDRGFDAEKWPAHLTIDAANERAFITAHLSLANDSSEEDAPTSRLTLCMGNYMSRNMVRRRATFSEMATADSQDSATVKLLDRTALWEERLPGIDTQHAPVEAFFEKDGVFWFLSGTGMELEMIETLAGELYEAVSPQSVDSQDS